MSRLLHDLPVPVVLALLIYGEARGEPVEGQIAVANVVHNRVVRSGHDWKAVCFAPWQFSCFNADDPNFPKIERAADVLMTSTPAGALAQAVWIAEGVIAGQVLDNTRGSQNYLTTDLLQSERAPKWAWDRPILARIGNHSFLSA